MRCEILLKWTEPIPSIPTSYFSPLTSRQGHPFSRSYGVILPSSLTRVLPCALGFSPHLPVSVYGTGTLLLARGFSWQSEIRDFGTPIFPPLHGLASSKIGICLYLLPHRLDVLFHPHASPTLLRHPFTHAEFGSTGFSTCCPSPTPFGLGLGPD